MNRDDLMKFCGGKNQVRLATPFSIGEFTYATNGHILVRVPRLADIPERTDAPPPAKVEEVFNHYKGDYQPIPAVGPIKTKSCPVCEGTGKFQTCPECDGTGLVSFSNDYNDYDFTCETCGGDGKFKEGKELECEKCAGTGKIVKTERVDAAGRKYDKKYLLMLKKLPGCKLAVGKELDPAHFIFDDGDGVIMPMRY
jgi:hypothetical protein